MVVNETIDNSVETEKVMISNERKKRSVIWGYFVVGKEDKSLHDL